MPLLRSYPFCVVQFYKDFGPTGLSRHSCPSAGDAWLKNGNGTRITRIQKFFIRVIRVIRGLLLPYYSEVPKSETPPALKAQTAFRAGRPEPSRHWSWG